MDMQMNSNSPKPAGKRRRIILRILLVYAAVFIPLEFFGGLAVRFDLDFVGTRRMAVRNLNYALSPDKREIVMTYELVTMRYYFPVEAIKSWDSAEPSRETVQKKEKRIPLDPMSDEVATCTVELIPDPEGYRSISFVKRNRNTDMPFLTLHSRLRMSLPEKKKKNLPDGMEYSLIVRPEDVALFSGPVLCGFSEGSLVGDLLVMIPCGVDENGRYEMLTQRDATMLWPFMEEPQLNKRRIDVTELESDSLSNWLKALFFPLCLLADFILMPLYVIVYLALALLGHLIEFGLKL